MKKKTKTATITMTSKSVQRRLNIQKGKPMEENVVNPKTEPKRLGRVGITTSYVVDLDNEAMVQDAIEALFEDLSNQENLALLIDVYADLNAEESEICDFLLEETKVKTKTKINKCPKCGYKDFDVTDTEIDVGNQILLELLCECYKCHTTWWANYTVKFDKIFNIVSEGKSNEDEEEDEFWKN
jgi:hypothetical protein